jgi:hypothetical protein
MAGKLKNLAQKMLAGCDVTVAIRGLVHYDRLAPDLTFMSAEAEPG